MAEIRSQFIFRRRLASEWASENPLLARGEPAWASDTFVLKIGDGVALYNDLPPVGGFDSVADVYNVAAGTPFAATATTLPLDTIRESDGGAYSVNTIAFTVRVTAAGRYRVHARASLALVSGNNTTGVSWVELDTVEIPGSRMPSGNLRSGASGGASFTGTIVVAANQEFRLRGIRSAGSGNLAALPNGCGLHIERVS